LKYASVGALALRITDRLHSAHAEVTDRSLSSVAALCALGDFLEPASIDDLRRVVGLTSSATVRLVDGLERDGLARREAGEDGRVSLVRLTATGRRLATRLAAARAAVLTDVLAPLTARERSTLAELVDQLLVPLARTPTPRGWMCRLCATQVCGAPMGDPAPSPPTRSRCQRESGVGVPEPFGYGLDRRTGGDEQRRVGVSSIVGPDSQPVRHAG
jgi:DNA-binding MarR family transcriptional regulator